MAKIIGLVNQKGGVGKTTTAVNLAVYLAYFGNTVLLVDIDPQSNATSGLGIKHNELPHGVYEAMTQIKPFRAVILGESTDSFRVAPATPALAGANVELVTAHRREHRLHDILQEVKDEYDFIVIDCPPSLGLLTLNGLVASDEVLIPVQAEYYALEGLGQLMHTIQLVQNSLKPDLGVLGAVITMYDKRTSLSDAVLRELYQYFPNKIFRTVIPRNVRLAEAPSYGQPILNYDARSKGGRAYERLAREILDVYNNNK